MLLIQPLRAFAFAPLAVHAAVHSPAGHLLLTETHVYAAAARYVHTAVAAGFTAGWYIEHKLALTPGHGESAASHPSPDGGRTHGEDAPREVVRARDTSIGHLTGAARLSSGSVHAPTPKSLGMSDTVTLTGGSPKPPSAVTVHSDTVRHHGYAEPMSIHSARGAQAPNRGGSGEEATAWAAGRTRDAAVHGQPTQGASPRSGGQLEDVGAPGAGVLSRGRRADEWSRAAAGRGRTGTPRAAAHGRLPSGRDGQTAPPPGVWWCPGHAPEPWAYGLWAGAEEAEPRETRRGGARRLRRLHARAWPYTHYQTTASPPHAAEYPHPAKNCPPELAQAREVAGAAADGRVTRTAGQHSGAENAPPSGAGSAAPAATPTGEEGADCGQTAVWSVPTPPAEENPNELQGQVAANVSVTGCRHTPGRVTGYTGGLPPEERRKNRQMSRAEMTRTTHKLRHTENDTVKVGGRHVGPTPGWRRASHAATPQRRSRDREAVEHQVARLGVTLVEIPGRGETAEAQLEARRGAGVRRAMGESGGENLVRGERDAEAAAAARHRHGVVQGLGGTMGAAVELVEDEAAARRRAHGGEDAALPRRRSAGLPWGRPRAGGEVERHAAGERRRTEIHVLGLLADQGHERGEARGEAVGGPDAVAGGRARALAATLPLAGGRRAQLGVWLAGGGGSGARRHGGVSVAGGGVSATAGVAGAAEGRVGVTASGALARAIGGLAHDLGAAGDAPARLVSSCAEDAREGLLDVLQRDDLSDVGGHPVERSRGADRRRGSGGRRRRRRRRKGGANAVEQTLPARHASLNTIHGSAAGASRGRIDERAAKVLAPAVAADGSPPAGRHEAVGEAAGLEGEHGHQPGQELTEARLAVGQPPGGALSVY